MRQISLSQGQFALVDDADYVWLNQWKWHALRHHNTFYAMRQQNNGDYSKRQHISMHGQILNLPQGTEGDHVDGNGLNNQRSNIRISTHQQNMHNMKKRSDNTSGFKGVTFDKRRNKWRAQIQVNNKPIHLGYFDTAESGHSAYQEASEKYHGEFGNSG